VEDRRLELEAVRVSGLRAALCLVAFIPLPLLLTRLVLLAEREALFAKRSNTLLVDVLLLTGRLLAGCSRNVKEHV
jgi:hypothetical protein